MQENPWTQPRAVVPRCGVLRSQTRTGDRGTYTYTHRAGLAVIRKSLMRYGDVAEKPVGYVVPVICHPVNVRTYFLQRLPSHS